MAETKPKMKGELCEEFSRYGDADSLIGAVCDATEITLNGKPLEPEGPIPANDFSDLLNAHLNLVGNTARFEFDDGSFFESTVVSKSGKDSGTIWSEWGFYKREQRRHSNG